MFGLTTGVPYLDLLIYIFGICSFIPAWVFVVLGHQVSSFNGVISMNSENRLVEFAWTVIPTFLVSILCYYNLHFLSQIGWSSEAQIVKIIGRQWYWSYEVNNGGVYDSYMGDFLNSVDKPLQLEYKVEYDFAVTAADVIHCVALPSFGVKVDAIPGRLNEYHFIADRVGTFVGYCSELCGPGHGYMPIVLEILIKQKHSIPQMSQGWLMWFINLVKDSISGFFASLFKKGGKD